MLKWVLDNYDWTPEAEAIWRRWRPVAFSWGERRARFWPGLDWYGIADDSLIHASMTFRRREGRDEESDFYAWWNLIRVRYSFNARRSRRRRRARIGGRVMIDLESIRSPESDGPDNIAVPIDELTDRDLAIVEAIVIGGRSQREVSGSLGIPRRSVRRILRRALLGLRRSMERQGKPT